jgi:dTDP-4-dehydrorhamnose reductase
MKILLLGSRGQLGWQLQRSLSVVAEVVALHRTSAPLCGDLSKPEELARTIATVAPDVIVNAAAFTAVDRAETERDAAFSINASACENLAREANRHNAWLIHYSTDDVFNGTGERAWREDDPTSPLNTYGASKLAGEQAIIRTHDRHLIIRCAWLFDTWGQNFLKSILRAAAQRESLNVVDDQWGAPTRAAVVADITAQILPRLRPEHAGIYHVGASGETNWHQYAALAVAHAAECGLQLKTGPAMVRPVSTAQYPTPARRPANSRLDTTRLRRTFDLVLPPWQDGVRAVVCELAAAQASQ